ncbi:hypothetical protein ACET3Z_002864 [Daucus carota]
MEPDGDDFGPLYSDHVVKPCSLVQEAGFSNDQSPSNHGAGSVFSANVVEGLREYDGFLLSQCGGGGECGADDVGMEENEGGFDGEGLDVDGKKGKMVDEKEVDVVAEMMDEDDVGFSAGDGDAQSFDVVCKGSDKKEVEIKEFGLKESNSIPEYLDDDLEPGEIPGMKMEFVDDVEARVGHSNQSSDEAFKKQLLQTSSPSKAVGNKSGQLQQIGEAIQVYISSVERVSCLENPHKRRCGSDAIIEIVCVDSADDTELFTKDLRDCALHEYKTRPTTIHKIINGDNILPFPLDGSFHQISDDERTSPWVMMNYALEGRWWREFELVVGKKKERFYNQERSVHLDYPKERTEAEQRLHGELENNRFHNSGRRSRRQGDSKYKRSSELPDESKPTANVYVNNEITKNRFDSSRMSIEETLSQTNYEGGSNDKFNIGSADDKGNCRMRRKETLSQTEHQEGNNNKMLDRGSAVKEDTCRIRIAETLSQVDHQEGNDNKKFNMGSAVHEDNCGMIIEETLSQTDDQEGNNDKRLNKGRTVHEDFYSKQATKPIDNHEQEFPSNCNLASNSGNNVIFGDQKHDAERGKNVDKESEKMQGSPEARESPSEDMKELMSNIRNLMTEIDDLILTLRYGSRPFCTSPDHPLICQSGFGGNATVASILSPAGWSLPHSNYHVLRIWKQNFDVNTHFHLSLAMFESLIFGVLFVIVDILFPGPTVYGINSWFLTILTQIKHSGYQ